jgi:ABC-2 type transport system ATP-binding protein
MIEVADLHVSFKTPSGRPVAAVDGLDLSVRRGEVVGFIGPNGAGKTTTIKVLMGFVKPSRGNVRLMGEPAGSVAARRRIGYLPEVALYYPFLSAREALRLYAKLADIPRPLRDEAISALIERVGLAGRDRERLSGFSKGMLQRVGIAQAIMGEPDLLILDEVTSGLDPVARHDVRRILMEFKEKGKTVFFSSHELTEVALLCDRIVLMDEGKTVEESDLHSMLASAHCVVLRVQHQGGALEKEGIMARMSKNGAHVYAADDWETAKAFQSQVEAQGGKVLESYEEPLSLEDYFVRKLGHKVA